MPRPPGLILTGAGNGIFRMPGSEDTLDFISKYKFRWFKRSIHYYFNPKTGTIVYPDWYLKELENLKI